MEKTHFTAICIGSEPEMLGYAAVHPDTLLLEKTESVSGCLIRGMTPLMLGEATTEIGKTISHLLQAKGYVLANGKIDTVALQAFLARYASERSISVLLRVVPIEILPCKDGRTQLTIFTNEGLLTLTCDRLLVPKVPERDAQGTYYALAHRLSKNDRLLLQEKGCRVEQGFEKNEWSVGLPCKLSTPPCEARFHLERIFLSLSQHSRKNKTGPKIDTVAVDVAAPFGFNSFCEAFESRIFEG